MTALLTSDENSDAASRRGASEFSNEPVERTAPVNAVTASGAAPGSLSTIFGTENASLLVDPFVFAFRRRTALELQEYGLYFRLAGSVSTPSTVREMKSKRSNIEFQSNPYE